MLAGIFATASMQDKIDKGELKDKKCDYLLRLLINIQKYLSARLSVEHIHHSLDILAGNGTIETFSSIPDYCVIALFVKIGKERIMFYVCKCLKI